MALCTPSPCHHVTPSSSAPPSENGQRPPKALTLLCWAGPWETYWKRPALPSSVLNTRGRAKVFVGLGHSRRGGEKALRH